MKRKDSTILVLAVLTILSFQVSIGVEETEELKPLTNTDDGQLKKFQIFYEDTYKYFLFEDLFAEYEFEKFDIDQDHLRLYKEDNTINLFMESKQSKVFSVEKYFDTVLGEDQKEEDFICSIACSFGQTFIKKLSVALFRKKMVFIDPPFGKSSINENAATIVEPWHISKVDKNCEQLDKYECSFVYVTYTYEQENISLYVEYSITDKEKATKEHFIFLLEIENLFSNGKTKIAPLKKLKLTEMKLISVKEGASIQQTPGCKIHLKYLMTSNNIDLDGTGKKVRADIILRYCYFGEVADQLSYKTNLQVIASNRKITILLKDYEYYEEDVSGKKQNIRLVNFLHFKERLMLFDTTGIMQIKGEAIISGLHVARVEGSEENMVFKNVYCAIIDGREIACLYLSYSTEKQELNCYLQEYLEYRGILVAEESYKIEIAANTIVGVVHYLGNIAVLSSYEDESIVYIIKRGSHKNVKEFKQKEKLCFMIDFSLYSGSYRKAVDGYGFLYCKDKHSQKLSLLYFSINFPHLVIKITGNLQKSTCMRYLPNCAQSKISFYNRNNNLIYGFDAFIVEKDVKTILEANDNRMVTPDFHNGEFLISIDEYFTGVIMNPKVVNPHSFDINLDENQPTYSPNEPIQSGFMKSFIQIYNVNGGFDTDLPGNYIETDSTNDFLKNINLQEIYYKFYQNGMIHWACVYIPNLLHSSDKMPIKDFWKLKILFSQKSKFERANMLHPPNNVNIKELNIDLTNLLNLQKRIYFSIEDILFARDTPTVFSFIIAVSIRRDNLSPGMLPLELIIYKNATHPSYFTVLENNNLNEAPTCFKLKKTKIRKVNGVELYTVNCLDKIMSFTLKYNPVDHRIKLNPSTFISIDDINDSLSSGTAIKYNYIKDYEIWLERYIIAMVQQETEKEIITHLIFFDCVVIPKTSCLYLGFYKLRTKSKTPGISTSNQGSSVFISDSMFEIFVIDQEYVSEAGGLLLKRALRIEECDIDIQLLDIMKPVKQFFPTKSILIDNFNGIDITGFKLLSGPEYNTISIISKNTLLIEIESGKNIYIGILQYQKGNGLFFKELKSSESSKILVNIGMRDTTIDTKNPYYRAYIPQTYEMRTLEIVPIYTFRSNQIQIDYTWLGNVIAVENKASRVLAENKKFYITVQDLGGRVYEEYFYLNTSVGYHFTMNSIENNKLNAGDNFLNLTNIGVVKDIAISCVDMPTKHLLMQKQSGMIDCNGERFRLNKELSFEEELTNLHYIDIELGGKNTIGSLIAIRGFSYLKRNLFIMLTIKGCFIGEISPTLRILKRVVIEERVEVKGENIDKPKFIPSNFTRIQKPIQSIDGTSLDISIIEKSIEDKLGRIITITLKDKADIDSIFKIENKPKQMLFADWVPSYITRNDIEREFESIITSNNRFEQFHSFLFVIDKQKMNGVGVKTFFNVFYISDYNGKDSIQLVTTTLNSKYQEENIVGFITSPLEIKKDYYKIELTLISSKGKRGQTLMMKTTNLILVKDTTGEGTYYGEIVSNKNEIEIGDFGNLVGMRTDKIPNTNQYEMNFQISQDKIVSILVEKLPSGELRKHPINIEYVFTGVCSADSQYYMKGSEEFLSILCMAKQSGYSDNSFITFKKADRDSKNLGIQFPLETVDIPIGLDSDAGYFKFFKTENNTTEFILTSYLSLVQKYSVKTNRVTWIPRDQNIESLNLNINISVTNNFDSATKSFSVSREANLITLSIIFSWINENKTLLVVILVYCIFLWYFVNVRSFMESGIIKRKKIHNYGNKMERIVMNQIEHLENIVKEAERVKEEELRNRIF